MSKESGPEIRNVDTWNKRKLTHQVISQELHDECGVFVALLTEGIQFCSAISILLANNRPRRTSNGIVKRLLGKMTRLIWGVENLIVKYREIEG